MQNIDLATLVIIASTVIITLIGFKDRSFFKFWNDYEVEISQFL